MFIEFSLLFVEFSVTDMERAITRDLVSHILLFSSHLLKAVTFAAELDWLEALQQLDFICFFLNNFELLFILLLFGIFS